jgi:hypothetical protein
MEVLGKVIGGESTAGWITTVPADTVAAVS